MKRGHLTERRPGVWRLVVSDGFDAAGRRRQIVRTVKGSKRDAQRALTTMLREKDDHKLADGRQPLERYLRSEWLHGRLGRLQAWQAAGPDHPSTLLRQRAPRLRPHWKDQVGRSPTCPR
jgi:hypothetical protein